MVLRKYKQRKGKEGFGPPIFIMPYICIVKDCGGVVEWKQVGTCNVPECDHSMHYNWICNKCKKEYTRLYESLPIEPPVKPTVPCNLKILKEEADKIMTAYNSKAVFARVHAGGDASEDRWIDNNSWRFVYHIDNASFFICANIKNKENEKLGQLNEYSFSHIKANKDIKFEQTITKNDKWNTAAVLTATIGGDR